MTRIFLLLAVAGICTLSVIAGAHYVGEWPIYLLFTLLSNALLFDGFRKNSIYFDTFIGVFLWLGFWLKVSLRVGFTSGLFRESIGAFDGSPKAYDHALIVSSCAFAAILIASLIRQRYFVYPDRPPACARSALFLWYRSYRKCVVALFFLAVIGVAGSNYWLGIYQRGMVTETVLPFGLNGVYKWLLQFGFASISALIVRFEIEMRGNLSWTSAFVPILESFLSNTSLLSRGMILNASAEAFGALQMISAMKRRFNLRVIVSTTAVFALLFAVSVFSVNYLRAVTLKSAQTAPMVAVARDMAPPLFVDRWVGIEGVMAVSSSRKLGWDLWREAWKEKYDETQLSLYDRAFIASPYTHPDIDKSRSHFVSLPGIVAFLYYPGSMGFLFIATLLCALAGAAFEIAIYRFCGQNWILCSLLAQVIAFRYVSFGYVPAQSYLFFGTLVLNGLIIYSADRLLHKYSAARRTTV